MAWMSRQRYDDHERPADSSDAATDGAVALPWLLSAPLTLAVLALVAATAAPNALVAFALAAVTFCAVLPRLWWTSAPRLKPWQDPRLRQRRSVVKAARRALAVAAPTAIVWLIAVTYLGL